MEGTTQLLQSPSLVGSYLSTWNPVVTLVLIGKDLILEGLSCHRTENKDLKRFQVHLPSDKFLSRSCAGDESHTEERDL